MKTIIFTFFSVFLLALTSFAQTPTPTPMPTPMSTPAPVPAKIDSVLRVEVEGGKSLDLTAKDLAKFTRREVKATAHDGKDAVYSGYNLSDILLGASAKLGKDEMRGKELSAYLVVEAADGYKVTFAIAELAPEFTDKVVLLADTRDGKALDAKQGTWQLIVPDDKKHGRWVRQVVALKVKKTQ